MMSVRKPAIFLRLSEVRFTPLDPNVNLITIPLRATGNHLQNKLFEGVEIIHQTEGLCVPETLYYHLKQTHKKLKLNDIVSYFKNQFDEIQEKSEEEQQRILMNRICGDEENADVERNFSVSVKMMEQFFTETKYGDYFNRYYFDGFGKLFLKGKSNTETLKGKALLILVQDGHCVPLCLDEESVKRAVSKEEITFSQIHSLDYEKRTVVLQDEEKKTLKNYDELVAGTYQPENLIILLDTADLRDLCRDVMVKTNYRIEDIQLNNNRQIEMFKHPVSNQIYVLSNDITRREETLKKLYEFLGFRVGSFENDF